MAQPQPQPRPETERQGNICGKCGESFETEDELKRHVEEEHAKQ